jgi:hypothetical protein
MSKQLITLLLSLSFSVFAHADKNKLQNSRLKDQGYDRLEGKSPYKPGCRHIIRSGDKSTIYHPTVISNNKIGLDYKGTWISVAASDKTKLRGRNEQVTVWRNCKRI